MPFEPWMLGAIDEAGYNGIREEHLRKVAGVLRQSPNDVIDTAEFRSVCRRCGISPDQFTQRDLDALQQMLE